MVEVYVSRVGLDAASNTYVLILAARSGEGFLPIWIGHPEAESIVAELTNAHRERPMTHDLIRRIIMSLGATVEHASISHVQANTYYAALGLRVGSETLELDARPSDSIAVAIRCGAPIFVADTLLHPHLRNDISILTDPSNALQFVEYDVPGTADVKPRLSPEELKHHLESLRPEDFGKFNL